MKIKRFNDINEGIRDKMTPKEVDIDKVIDFCFLKDHPDGYFKRAWKADETIPEETDNLEIILNMGNFIYMNIDERYTNSSSFYNKVLKEIDKDALRQAMKMVLEEVIEKSKQEKN